MLKALWEWFWPKDAVTPSKRRDDKYVTQEQLELALEGVTKELEYEWNEWYEKFNTLHLRLSKREKRKAQGNNVQQQEFQEEPQPSVLAFRRLGSP